MSAPSIESIVIIGSGPAAWTAAIYAARAKLNPLVFEGEPIGTDIPGGQLMLTTDIENFPGFPAPITGPQLMDRMKEQAVHAGARVITERIEAVDLLARPIRLTPTASPAVLTHSVVIATGAKAKWLDLPNEMRLAMTGGGVSACAVCDAALHFFRDKVLAVVGGGDTAMEEALYCTKFASEVLLIHRRDSFRASKTMLHRVMAHPKIRVVLNTRVVDVLGDAEITGLRLADTVTGVERTQPVGGLFVAIGHAPNTGFLGGQLALTPYGYIVVSPGRTATAIPGVFAAGDVIDDYYRQAITSAGTGCMAALEAERYLAHHGLGESPVLETAETTFAGADLASDA
jgi:thioredoxin reductase (NADPH)